MGKTLADLQSNISISAQNAVTGDINWVTGYTGFSSDFRLQAGWYIALKIDASTIEGALEGATITATYNGRDVTLDSDQIIIIRLAEGEDSITFTANKEGYTEGRLTLDFSGLDKQEVNQSVYLTSETTGITISPMQFGNTKTISGQVPWDSTTSSNVMELTAYPFFNVPSGTTYSLEGTYNGAGANIQITDGTFSSLDEVSMTFSVPSAIIGQEGATFILMFEDPDTNRDYFTYNVTGLTLEPDPRPKVNITSDTQGITISPSSYATSKTATGQVPYDTTTQQNILSLALTTSGTLPSGPYTIEVFAQGDVMQQPIWYTTGASTIPQSIPIPLTSSNVGTGKYITVNISGVSDPEFNIITIDTSALTLQAAPRLTLQNELLFNGNYLNTPISNYWTGSSTSTYNSNNTYKDNNGYYGFLAIKGLPQNFTLTMTCDAVEVTSDITNSGLSESYRIFKYNIGTNTNKDYVGLEIIAPGYQPYNRPSLMIFGRQRTDSYSNGLNGRNMGISPLSSTVKAAGFGDYCDLTFTPIDPATATIVNNEVTVNVSGTIKSKSGSATLGATLTDYQPMYKNWPGGYNAYDKENDMYIDSNKYYFIIEATSGFKIISSYNGWKCKGFETTQTTFTQLKPPEILSNALKTIWAIPIENGMTSVSIKCIAQNTDGIPDFPEVTYTFDLTNVTYGTIS